MSMFSFPNIETSFDISNPFDAATVRNFTGRKTKLYNS